MNLTQQYNIRHQSPQEIVIDFLTLNQCPDRFGYVLTAVYDNKKSSTSINMEDFKDTEELAFVLEMLKNKIESQRRLSHPKDYISTNHLVKLVHDLFKSREVFRNIRTY